MIPRIYFSIWLPGYRTIRVLTFRNILANKTVRYVGEPVLAIIAETIEIAEEAADFVHIEYEEMKDEMCPICHEELLVARRL